MYVNRLTMIPIVRRLIQCRMGAKYNANNQIEIIIQLIKNNFIIEDKNWVHWIKTTLLKDEQISLRAARLHN